MTEAMTEKKGKTGFEAMMQASLGGALKGGTIRMKAKDDGNFNGKLHWNDWSNDDWSNLWGEKRGSDGLPAGETSDVHIFAESLLNHHTDSSFEGYYPTADIRIHLLVPREMVDGLRAGDPEQEQALVDTVSREHPLIGVQLVAYHEEESDDSE